MSSLLLDYTFLPGRLDFTYRLRVAWHPRRWFRWRIMRWWLMAWTSGKCSTSKCTYFTFCLLVFLLKLVTKKSGSNDRITVWPLRSSSCKLVRSFNLQLLFMFPFRSTRCFSSKFLKMSLEYFQDNWNRKVQYFMYSVQYSSVHVSYMLHCLLFSGYYICLGLVSPNLHLFEPTRAGVAANVSFLLCQIITLSCAICARYWSWNNWYTSKICIISSNARYSV